MTLSGTLSDGSTFSNLLDSTTPVGALDFGPFDTLADLQAVPGFASLGSTITVTLVVPLPVLGDVNLDGVVNFLDISPFISVLSGGPFQIEADVDENGVVNFLDISPFIATLSGS